MSKKIILPILLIGLLGGCAAPATKESMIVRPNATSTPIKAEQKGKFVVKNVGGGSVTNPMWTSQVSKEAFDAALKESLATAGYTSDAPLDGQYKIDADLVTLKQPMFGLTFDVVSTVNYRIYKDAFEKIMSITATGTATTSDAFVGMTRLKIANEKSMQQNIAEFIKQLAASDIK
ncbi:MAG: hypothetical protein HOP06_07285 [Methylotenera sp.]|nr:hypothetical protein [Methylotenera sp.]